MSGFTVTELMLVLAMAGALVVLAIPSFSQFFENNRVTTNTNDFAAVLTQARSEAIKRGSNVVLCAGNYGAGCTGTWNDGWIMFEDLDEDGVLDDTLTSANDSCTDGEECLVEIGVKGLTFTSASDTSLAFKSSGELDIGFNDEPEFCVSDNRAIKLNQIGRISITNEACPGT